MREYEELELLSLNEIYEIYNDLMIRKESEKISREDKYKIEYLQSHIDDCITDAESFVV